MLSRQGRWTLLVCAAAAVSAQDVTKDYIRVGSKVVAIETVTGLTANPDAVNIGGAGGNVVLAITTASPALQWRPAGAPAWVTFPEGTATRTGPGSVTLAIAANGGSTPRQGSIRLELVPSGTSVVVMIRQAASVGGTDTVVLTTTPANPGSTPTPSGTFQFAINNTAPVQRAQVIFNYVLSGFDGCTITYSRGTPRRLGLAADDQGTESALPFDASGQIANPGAVLFNGACRINSASVVASPDERTVTLTLGIEFFSSMPGSFSIYSSVTGPDGSSSAWNVLRTWTAFTPSTAFPAITNDGLLVPQTGTQIQPTFRFSSPNGRRFVDNFLVTIAAKRSFSRPCSLRVYPIYRAGFAVSDDGLGIGGVVSALAPGTATNRRCAIGSGMALLAQSAQEWRVQFPVSFSDHFFGGKNLYGDVADRSNRTAFYQQNNGPAPGYVDPNIFPAEPWGTAPNNLAPFTINNGVIASIAQTGVSGSVPVGGGFYSYVVTAPPDVEWRAKPLVSGVTLLSSEVDSEGSATRLIAVGPQAVSSPQNVLQVHPFAPYAPFVNVSSLLLGAQDTQVQTFPFPIQAAGQPPPPDLPSISPASGSGEFATFTITITNYHGNRSMAPVELIINSGFTTAGSCYVYFFGDIPNTPNYPLTAYVGLGAEGGNPDGWIRFNQAGSPYASGGTLSNAYCELIREEAGVPTTSVQYNPNLRSIQLRVRLRFQSTFRGLRQLYVRQRDRLTGNSDQVHTLGSWTPFPPLPVTVSLLSASSSPAAQGTFTYRVTNQNGATDTVGSQLFFVPPNQPETSTQACIGLYYWYSPPVILVFDPTIQMYRQFGSVPTGAPPNQCRILSFSTTVVNSTTRDITWQMGFTGIPGLKNVYLKAISNASPQGQSPITTWTVQ